MHAREDEGGAVPLHYAAMGGQLAAAAALLAAGADADAVDADGKTPAQLSSVPAAEWAALLLDARNEW